MCCVPPGKAGEKVQCQLFLPVEECSIIDKFNDPMNVNRLINMQALGGYVKKTQLRVAW